MGSLGVSVHILVVIRVLVVEQYLAGVVLDSAHHALLFLFEPVQ